MNPLHNPKSIPPMTVDELKIFAYGFERMTAEAHAVNVRNGWWEKRELIDKILSERKIDNTPHLIIELLGLVNSEVAEAVEAVRKHDPATWGDPVTKDTLVRELGGAIVRIMDIAAKMNLPLGQAIVEEVQHNATRGHRHGGKAA